MEAKENNIIKNISKDYKQGQTMGKGLLTLYETTKSVYYDKFDDA